jgi:hypothetical protein
MLHALNTVLFVLARLSMLYRHILKVNQFSKDVPVLSSTLLPKEHVFISCRNQSLEIKTPKSGQLSHLWGVMVGSQLIHLMLSHHTESLLNLDWLKIIRGMIQH